MNSPEAFYFTVASSSMEPVLIPGDKITAYPVSSEEIKVGAVIVYKNKDGKLIVHRVLKIKGFVCITAGDNLRKIDKPLHIYDIVGLVKNLEIKKPLSKTSRTLRAVKRHLKYLQLYIKKTWFDFC